MTMKRLYAGAKLREIRQRLNITQKEFARKLGVSLPYANQMENNHPFITCDMVILS
jgi:transcriptional regulator with XRE-family HTH domain